MRHVIRSYTRKPAILKHPTTLASLQTIATSGNSALIRQRLYFDPYATSTGPQSRVLDKLREWYKSKCAYCERLYKLDVEHYRPKGRITDENGGVISATGYYWLCYEWSNLLPSCISCNREGGKVDKFPIIGIRVTAPYFRKGLLAKSKCLVHSPHFISERPYLINPEVDDPVNFFAFKISDSGKGIEMYGVDADNRGDITQKICKLNRPEIRIERAQVILDFVEALHSIFKLHQNGLRTLPELHQGVEDQLQALYDKAANIELTHTLLRRFVVRNVTNFQNIVLPFIASGLQKIILKAFNSYTPI